MSDRFGGAGGDALCHTAPQMHLSRVLDLRARDAPDICAWSCLDLLGREPEVSERVLCQLIVVVIEDQIVKGANHPRELATDHKLLHELPARRDIKF